jgi:hypothetical protein
MAYLFKLSSRLIVERYLPIFLSETVAMHPQYWSRVVQVSSTNSIPYASDAMVGNFGFKFSLIKNCFICIHFIYRLSTMLCDVTYQKTAHFTRIKIFKDNVLNINILTNKI